MNDQTTWDLSPLFSSDSDPTMSNKRMLIEEKINKFVQDWKDRTDYLEQPEVLLKALNEYEELMRNVGTDGDEGYYFWLRTQQDENNAELKARFDSIQNFGNKMKTSIQFFTLRIAKIPKEHQGSFLSSPKLKKYKHYLERLFIESKHLLSEPEERIIILKSAAAHHFWVRMTSSFLAKEESEVIGKDIKNEKKNFSELLSLMNDKNKNVRDSAANGFNTILKKYVEVAEAEINAILSNKKTDDDLRGISRPDLSRHLDDDIETEVVDSVLQSVSERFDISTKFYALKAKLMAIPHLEYHERNVEYGSIDKSYSYDESVQLIHTVFRNLDKEFDDIFTYFLNNRRIDVYPVKGKRSGAFCVYNLLSQPTYLLLNHTDKLQDVTTLAHELGHGINDELMRKKQHALYFGTPLSTAEVASTFMEDFVLQEILRQADDELRLAIQMTKLNSDISSIFRQVACYQFEQNIHEDFRKKGYLSASDIGKIFQKHMVSYMGSAVEQSAGAENWWVYWSHIRSFFYVYSYASGLLISKSLQASVKKDPEFINKVKVFLSAGSSDSPKNIFSHLGIDITNTSFWQNGLNEVDQLLSDTTKLAKKLGKI